MARKTRRSEIRDALGVSSLNGIGMKERMAAIGVEWKPRKEKKRAAFEQARHLYGSLGRASKCVSVELTEAEKAEILKKYT